MSSKEFPTTYSFNPKLMPSSRRSNSIVTALFFLIVAVGGLYAANKGILSSNQGGGALDALPASSQGTPTIVESGAASKTAELPSVVVGIKTGNTFKLVGRPQTGDEKTYFTDTDEQTKVQQLLGTDFKGLVYAWTSGDAAGIRGQLATIATDGSGRLTLIGQPLAATTAPTINPSGTQVAYVGFDNSEGSFGFTLLLDKTTGGALRSLDSSPDGIALPRFAQNDSLAYTVGQATPDKGQEVRVHVGSNHTTRFTTDKNQLISDLVWLGNDRLAIVVEPLGNNAANQAQILIVNASDGSIVTTIDKPGKERSLQATASGAVLGFITGEVSGLASEPGTVTLIDLATGTEATRGEATSIAGFLQ